MHLFYPDYFREFPSDTHSKTGNLFNCTFYSIMVHKKFRNSMIVF